MLKKGIGGAEGVKERSKSSNLNNRVTGDGCNIFDIFVCY